MVLCGASGLRCGFAPWEIDPRDCLQVVMRLTASADFVIVDCGAGVSSLTRRFSLASDLLILVTTPEPTAVVDAYATLKILCTRGFRGSVGLVVNMAHTRRDAEVTTQRLRTAAREFLGLSVMDLGCVPFDRHVPLAVQQRCPLAVRYPLCSASIGIDESSRRFARKDAGGVPAGTLLEKVAKLFL
jgi:flagellar biosynthesis protein FlhG